MQTVRVSLPGFSATAVSPDPRNFSLIADQDNILIKEFARGTVSPANGATATVAHNLGYTPNFFVYTQLASGRYRVTNDYNTSSSWRVYADATNLYIVNNSGATRSARYYIFYDDLN